jgi:hypothetical protein
MGCIKATRPKEANSHSRTSSNKCGKRLAVCSKQVTTLPTLALRLSAEVEDELVVIWEKSKSIDCSICEEKLLSEIKA